MTSGIPTPLALVLPRRCAQPDLPRALDACLMGTPFMSDRYTRRR
jgi:hypothetical protein